MTEATTLHRTSSELLGEAVHQHGRLSRQGTLERAFTLAFRSMVYPQIWEDPVVDLQALQLTETSRVVTIASGGCNVLSYLTANPERIFAVDLNETHVALVNLKLAAARFAPDYTSFFKMFGDARWPGNVDLYDNVLVHHLDEESKAYWEGRDLSGRRRINKFARNFYTYGLLGRFISAGHIFGRLLGANPKLIMNAKSRDEQIELFEKHLAPLFDKRVVKWVTAQRASLFGLGIPPAQYDALCEHGTIEMSEVLKERLRRLATDFDLKDNYFAWQAFARGYDQSGRGSLPPYLEQKNFPAIRIRAHKASVIKQNLIEFLRQQPTASLDRYILLDAQDWMNDDTLNALWREITRTSRHNARVIFRTAGRETILPGRVVEPTLSNWHYDMPLSTKLYAEDRSAIYGGFHVYIKTV